jgi:hypothetical protein
VGLNDFTFFIGLQPDDLFAGSGETERSDRKPQGGTKLYFNADIALIY